MKPVRGFQIMQDVDEGVVFIGEPMFPPDDNTPITYHMVLPIEGDNVGGLKPQICCYLVRRPVETAPIGSGARP